MSEILFNCNGYVINMLVKKYERLVFKHLDIMPSKRFFCGDVKIEIVVS